MADVKKTLDEIQQRLDEERQEEEALEKGLQTEEAETRPPTFKPDHAKDGGVI